MYVRRLIDILGLYFLLRFTEKPLRFFGLIGAVLAGTGGIALAVMFVQRLFGDPLGDRPLLLLAVLLTVLGVQAIALGLVGEMIVHFNASRRRELQASRAERAERRESGVAAGYPLTGAADASASAQAALERAVARAVDPSSVRRLIRSCTVIAISPRTARAS